MITLERLKSFITKLIENPKLEFINPNTRELHFIKDNLEFLIVFECMYWFDPEPKYYYSIDIRSIKSDYGINIIQRRRITKEEYQEFNKLLEKLRESIKKFYSDQFEKVLDTFNV